MKKKFEYMMKYFKALKCGDLNIRLDVESINEIQYQVINCENRNINELPSTIQEIFEEICDLYFEDIYEYGPGGSNADHSEYYYVDIIIDTKNETLIFNEVDFTEYSTESTNEYYEFEEYSEGDSMYDTFTEVREFMEKAKVNKMVIKYNGSGDNGYIDQEVYTNKGKFPMEDFIRDLCYELLETFGGWEINEGSQGEIIFKPDSIEIDHEWNTEESYTNEANILVTKDSFDE
jgi:hypothetical protein